MAFHWRKCQENQYCCIMGVCADRSGTGFLAEEISFCINDLAKGCPGWSRILVGQIIFKNNGNQVPGGN